MEAKLTLDLMLPASRCDHTGTLGQVDIFNMFQDIATDHAHLLGFGADRMIPEGRFWMTIAVRIRVLERPRFCERVTVETWPHTPAGIRCIRDYRLSRGGRVCVLGSSQWAVYNRNTGRVDRPDTVFPADLPCCGEQTIPDAFCRVRDEGFGEPFATHRVLSTDIDVNGHMNNVAYVRAFFSLFSTEELDAMDIRDMEVQYKGQCYEGEILEFSKKTENGADIYRAGAGGRLALFIVIRKD